MGGIREVTKLYLPFQIPLNKGISEENGRYSRFMLNYFEN